MLLRILGPHWKVKTISILHQKFKKTLNIDAENPFSATFVRFAGFQLLFLYIVFFCAFSPASFWIQEACHSFGFVTLIPKHLARLSTSLCDIFQLACPKSDKFSLAKILSKVRSISRVMADKSSSAPVHQLLGKIRVHQLPLSIPTGTGTRNRNMSWTWYMVL